MCCTPRKDRGIKYTYTAASSPWNQSFLYRAWLFQLVTHVVVAGLSVGLIPLKMNEIRQDDGYSFIFYFLSAIIFASTAVTFIGFLVLQLYWYKKNELHPGWALVCSSYMTFLYVFNVGMTVAALINCGGYFRGFEVVILAQLACSFPGFYLQGYHVRVNDNFRKTRKRERDIELQNEPQ